MEQDEIPEDIRRFILNRVDSVSHLEAILLMSASAEKPWSEDEIAARLYVSGERAHAILRDLVRQRLVVASDESPQEYRYDPTWDEGGIIPRVATAYRKHLVFVASLLHSKASAPVREFARAFQFKDEK